MRNGAALQSTADWSPGDKVRLETPNFIIRSMEPEDVDDRFVSWFADENYMHRMGSNTRRSRDEVVRHINRMNNSRDFLLGIFARDTALVGGWFRVYHEVAIRRAKLNILIGEKLNRGRRNIGEMNLAIHDFMFDDLRVRKVFTTVYGHNIHSRRLLERSGYQVEGQLRQHGVTEDGAWVDIFYYGMLPSDWRTFREVASDRP